MNAKKVKALRRQIREALGRAHAQHEEMRADGVGGLPEIREEQLLRLQKRMARRIRRLMEVRK